MRVLSSLTNRIFVASALLAVMSIAVAVYVVNAAVTAQAEAELQRGLEEAGSLVEQYQALLFDNLTRQARLIADLPRFKAAVALDDPPTVQPLADEYRSQITADLLVVTGRAGRVLGESGGAGLAGAVATGAIEEALRRRETTSFWPQAEGVLQVVTLPIWIGLDQPEVLGTLSVAVRLDRALALQFKALTESEIAFAVGRTVQASTFDEAAHPRLLPLLAPGGASRLVVGDHEYVALVRSLAPGRPAGNASGETAGTPAVLILRSRTERLRFLGRLHTALGATALVALLGATLLGYGVARTVTRPLGAITATMREMAATGDLGRKITLPAGRWIDEDAELLARTFDAMTESIARFQREEAQRERHSVLGRLSTVMAHEIGNPLMIIKTSLRTLRRPGTPPETVAAAVADIDEEIARLNRIVSEVLDFARPIRLEYAAADLNALCRDATAAAMAGEEGLSVDLDLDPAVGTGPTDAERLRLVLVNVLTNARHAVRAAESGAVSGRGAGSREVAPEAPIRLTTRRTGPERVTIAIRDHGVGIRPDDLPRIFEPYFTTRRHGSGLGLAIARNIVEGLGGSIAAHPASPGAEVRIDLPFPPAAPVAAPPPALPASV
jgi:signal transduction histidine kinase